MKVLVTGAAGFIGTNLLIKLFDRRIQTVGVDSFFAHTYSSDLKRRNWEYVKSVSSGQIVLYEVNLLDANLPTLFADVTHVVHLAAVPGQAKSWKDAREYWENNVLATQLILQEIYKRKIKLIFSSSSSVYGNIIEGDENTPKSPISPYGVTKLASEDLIDVFANRPDSVFKSVILRPFSVYGPRQRPDMGIYRFIDSIINEVPIEVFGDGSALRTFTYVDDVVSAILTSIHSDNLIGKFNICGNQSASVLEVIDMLFRITGKSTQVTFNPERLGDQKETKGISSKAEKSLGFKPSLSLEQGLKNQVLWQKENINSSTSLKKE